jgi:hypothetical protein
VSWYCAPSMPKPGHVGGAGLFSDLGNGCVEREAAFTFQ